MPAAHASHQPGLEDDLVKRVEAASNIFVVTDEVLRALVQTPALARAMATARSANLAARDSMLAAPELAHELTRPLAALALREMILPSLALECVLTRLRRWLLKSVIHREPLPEGETALALALNLALQCWLNEFVWEETPEESLWVDILESNVQSALLAEPQDGVMGVVVLACYRPLHQSARVADLVLQNLNRLPRLSDIARVTITEPRRETQLRDTFRGGVTASDAVSRAVKQQYEEHPYPRWTRPIRHEPVTALQHWRVVLPPAAARTAPAAEPLDILIAGCGTGHQVAAVASRLPCSRIHAIDLSSASLAYTQRKVEELALGNVTVELADILDLRSRPAFARRFDYIECFGVLHHMADPPAGLRSLAACAKPGAIMYLGLYSKFGSGQILPTQRAIAALGLQRTPRDIRRLRDMIARAVLRGERLPFNPNGLEHFIDYYSMSMCRDLLFHVCEHFFEVRDIQPLLEQAGLELVCFELPAGMAKKRYLEQFPDDPGIANAESFSMFEATLGGLGGIHRFYARKPEA